MSGANNSSFEKLPNDLPVPHDDGAADHLEGCVLPDVSLQSTSGRIVRFARLSPRCILFIYPKMGRPGQPMPPGWDETPGARGCTPQSCGLRDRYVGFQDLGYMVFGISSQKIEEQIEAARRLHLPFELLSDPDMVLAKELSLPTFQIAGMDLYKRLTLVVEDGSIAKVFYPVYPPQLNAEEVLGWLRARNKRTQSHRSER